MGIVHAPGAAHCRWIHLRATLVEREGNEWLLLGRPDTRIEWILQEYTKYQKVLSSFNMSCSICCQDASLS